MCAFKQKEMNKELYFKSLNTACSQISSWLDENEKGFSDCYNQEI
jgi:hypothetical protein